MKLQLLVNYSFFSEYLLIKLCILCILIFIVQFLVIRTKPCLSVFVQSSNFCFISFFAFAAAKKRSTIHNWKVLVFSHWFWLKQISFNKFLVYLQISLKHIFYSVVIRYNCSNKTFFKISFQARQKPRTSCNR